MKVPRRRVVRVETTVPPYRREFLACGHWTVEQVRPGREPKSRSCYDCAYAQEAAA